MHLLPACLRGSTLVFFFLTLSDALTQKCVIPTDTHIDKLKTQTNCF